MAPTATRRTVLTSAATLLAGRAAAQQATTLKLYSWGYRGGPAALVAEVPRLTSGRYRVERITGFDGIEAALGRERAAGGDSALFEGVRRGDVDLVATSAYSLGEYVPETQALYVPFLFRNIAHARAVLDGPVGQDLLGRLTAQGLVGLAWAEDGLRHLANSKRPIRTPDDLKGLKLRTAPNPVLVETFRGLGAEVTPTPWGRAAVDALARGDFDGTDTSVFALWTWELFRSLRYLSLTGHCHAPGIIVMSRAVYDRLSDADREALVEAARSSGQLDREQGDDEEAAGVADLLGAGMQINAEVDKAAFRAALTPAYAMWREQFGDLIDRIQDYQ